MRIFFKSFTKHLINYLFSGICYAFAVLSLKYSLEWILTAAEHNQFTTMLCAILFFIAGFTFLAMGISGFEDLTGIKPFKELQNK